MNYIYRVLDYMAWFWFMEWLILVYIINRIIHGRLEIWNLSSRVHIRYLTRSLRSLVRYRCEHSKINSISPRDHILFSIYFIVCFFVHRQVLFIAKLLYFTKVALYLVFLNFNSYNKLSGSFLQNEERRRPEEGRT